MPFNKKADCGTCKLIKAGDKKLLDRINRSKEFVPGGESLAAIHRDYQGRLTYKSIYNHSKRHQAPNKRELERLIRNKETKDALKDIQTVETGRRVAVYSNQADMRHKLLQKAMEALESDDLKMTMNAVVGLLGQEQKAEEAAKDRNLELMKMFNYFASGSAPRVSNPAAHTTVEEGEILGV
jgi:hypothetical protein